MSKRFRKIKNDFREYGTMHSNRDVRRYLHLMDVIIKYRKRLKRNGVNFEMKDFQSIY